MTQSLDENLPADWNRYRAYLRFLSNSAVPDELRAKLDPSDIVQQTLVQALNALPSFAGSSEGEMLAWLRQILARTVAHSIRDYNRQRRDVFRERAITAVESSSIRMTALIKDQGGSPPDEVIRAERILHLCEAIESLPDAQREAVSLHHLKGLTISEVAVRMDRSVASVGGLLKRGLKALRDSMGRV